MKIFSAILAAMMIFAFGFAAYADDNDEDSA